MPQYPMTFPECIEFLKEAEYGFLAMTMYGQPYNIPVNFVYDERELIFLHSKKEGQKIDYLAFNPNVCLSACRINRRVKGANPCSAGYRYESVLVFGTVRPVEDRAEKINVLASFAQKYQGDSAGASVGEIPEEALDSVEILEISFKEVFGKKNVDGDA